MHAGTQSRSSLGTIPFLVIKRKLYIRSPRHIADEAVTASRKSTRSTVYVDATPLERKFFELECAYIGSSPSIFGVENASLRQMMIHPEACKKLREHADGGSKSVGRFATVNSFAKLPSPRPKSGCGRSTVPYSPMHSKTWIRSRLRLQYSALRRKRIMPSAHTVRLTNIHYSRLLGEVRLRQPSKYLGTRP